MTQMRLFFRLWVFLALSLAFKPASMLLTPTKQNVLDLQNLIGKLAGLYTPNEFSNYFRLIEKRFD